MNSFIIGGWGDCSTDAAANEDIVASVLENCVSLRSLRLRESSFRNHDDAILRGTQISTRHTTHAHDMLELIHLFAPAQPSGRGRAVSWVNWWWTGAMA
jgi:hypothetical protein